MPVITAADEDQIDVNDHEIPALTLEIVRSLTLLVLTVMQSIVDEPDSIRIRANANHRRVMFTVRVSERDVPLAVGRQGANANALRLLLIAACRKLGYRFDMDICGPSGGADWSSS